MASAPPAAPPKKKKIPLLVVLLPLLAVLGIAGVVGLNLYREYMKSEQDDDEARKQLEVAQGEKIRARRPVEAVVDAGPSEDDLGNLPAGMRKKPVVKAVTPKSPADKAYLQFKAAYEKLENANESAARKFRAKKLQLDDQYRDGKPTNESKFIGDCDSTKDKILELLRNPENQ